MAEKTVISFKIKIRLINSAEILKSKIYKMIGTLLTILRTITALQQDKVTIFKYVY